MGRKLIDLKGKKFSRLSVIRLGEKSPIGALWECQCDCGSIKFVYGHLLRRGQVKSCGCLKSDVSRAMIKEFRDKNPPPRLTHGEARARKETAEWRLWSSIKNRCRHHQDYCSKGVRMHKEWEESFDEFVKYVGRRPSPDYSLDRIDVRGNYEPGNVRWATRKEQARNRRTNLYIECFGKRLTLAEWAEITGIKNTTIRNRLRLGWLPENALTKPVHKVI